MHNSSFDSIIDHIFITCNSFHTGHNMADDTRQNGQKEDLSKGALTVHPENKAFSGSQWQDPQASGFKPPENANMMAGGTQHTAGGKEPEVTLYNALTTGAPITEIHKRPCVRDSLLYGIGGGVGVGATRIIFASRSKTWGYVVQSVH